MKKQLLSLILALALCVGLLTSFSAFAATSENLLKNGSFDDEKSDALWSKSGQTVSWVSGGANGSKGCIKFSDIVINYTGFEFALTDRLSSGNYRFSGWFRTADKGSVSQIRFESRNTANQTETYFRINISDEWMYVDGYFTVPEGTALTALRVCGGPYAGYVQPYCVDEFSLVAVDSIPADAKTVFGENVTEDQAKASWTVPSTAIYDAEKESQYKVNGLVINQDADGFIRTCSGATVEGIKAFARQFEGSHITDYMICVNNTNATYPSKVWDNLLNKYHETEQNGQKVDWTTSDIARGAYQVYEVLNVDYISLWIDEFKDMGINPWISFRMNDAHDLTQETSVLLNDFFHNHVEMRRVQHHDTVSYFDNCRDYGQKEARDYMLALIEESLERYDSYGIELDFQREIWMFQIGREYDGIEIMNQFMRDVQELVKAAEEKRGHDIKVAVVVASDIQTNMNFGLNVIQWANEGLVDMITPKGRWSVSDNDMPILTWKTVLAAYPEIELCAGIENQLGISKSGFQTLETYNGAAANFYAQGADKIYLYNAMRGYRNGDVIEDSDKVYVRDSVSIGSNASYWQMITTLGSAEKVQTRPRRLLLTYNDTKSLWQTSNGTEQLPRTVNKNGYTTFRIPVGNIEEGSTVTLKFSCSKDNMKGKFINLFVNSVACEFVNEEACDGGYTSYKLLCYDVPSEAWSGYLVVEMASRLFDFQIDHMEVVVTPAA